MSASTQCPHNDVHLDFNLAAFSDTNIRFLELKAACKLCGAPMRFRGMRFGLNPNVPTMAADGSEASLPLMFGDEEYDGKMAGFTGRMVTGHVGD